MKIKIRSRKVKVENLSVVDEWEREARVFKLISSDNLPCRGFVIPDSTVEASNDTLKPEFV